nr:uncharacterized protein LOC126054853 [Helicoverpa armigera]
MEHARPPSELSLDGGPASRAEAWKRWRQQLTLFLKASGAYTETAGVQASLLVNLIGPEGFDIYQTFTFDKEEDRDDIRILLEKFDSFFVSKLNITLIRYKFFTRNQEEGESIQQYVTALRLLSKNCNFKELEDELIKDRIVCGIRSLRVRDRLLRCEDLNLDKAVKLCQAEEISRESEQQMDAVGTSSGVAQVDVVGAQRRRGRGSAGGGRRGARRGAAPSPHLCARCGGLSPRCQAGKCPADQCTCFVCGNRGHFAKVCKANAFYKGGGTARVCDIKHRSESESDDGDSFFISMIEGNKRLGEWFEILSGTEKFKLDTGADINVMSFERFLELGLGVSILKCNKVIKLQSYSGDVIPVKGTCYIACVYKGKQYELKFAIADMKCQSVLGQISCIQLNLIKRIHSLNFPQSNGKSERAVQTVKSMLIKCLRDNSDFQLALLNYRNTPRDGLSSPSQLLMSRQLRCKLPVSVNMLKPKVVEEHETMLQKQIISKRWFDRNTKVLPELKCGDEAICLNGKNKRTRCKVIGQAGFPRSYFVETSCGNKVRRNRRHLIKCEPIPVAIDVAPASSDQERGIQPNEKDAAGPSVTSSRIPPGPLTRAKAKLFTSIESLF